MGRTLFFRRKKPPEPLSKDQLQRVTKVLIIDDEEPRELRDLLKREGWKTFYLDDLDSLSHRKLVESQIICIDIMGVGEKLQAGDGMGLVKHIKTRHPEKKIILYSSVPKQNIFSDALDYVDKRLRKESSLIPFVTAIEEMAESTFSWDQTVRYAYDRLEGVMGAEISFEEFKSAADKALTRQGWNAKAFSKKAGVALDAAHKVASLVSLAVA